MKEFGPNPEQAKARQEFGMMFDAAKAMLENGGQKGGSFKNEWITALAIIDLPYKDAAQRFRNTSLSREVVLNEGAEPLEVTLRTSEKPRKSKRIMVELEGFSEVLELNRKGGKLHQIDEESGDLVYQREADISNANHYKRIFKAFPDE